MGLFSRWRKSDDAEPASPSNGTATQFAAAVEDRAGTTTTGDQRANEVPEINDTPPDIDTSAFSAPAPAPSGGQPSVGPPDAALTAELQGKIVAALKTVFDPEIPVDIYELGLIYDIGVDADRRALIKMTLTSPACPSAQQIPSEVRFKVKALPEISDAAVEIVWEPPWDKDRMSEAAKLQLGFY
jgi:FeS assembly SUF system protein